MRTAASGRKNGIFSLFWTVLVQINYLDFVDDLALLSHHQRQMKDKNSINRSGNQDQSRQQKTEDHQHCPKHQSQMLMSPSKLNPSSTREVWLARKVAKTVTSSQKLAREVLHLPCLRTSGPQGSDKLQILNSNRKSLYCYMEQREGEQPNNEDASYYTLYYIL